MRHGMCNKGCNGCTREQVVQIADRVYAVDYLLIRDVPWMFARLYSGLQ